MQHYIPTPTETVRAQASNRKLFEQWRIEEKEDPPQRFKPNKRSKR